MFCFQRPSIPDTWRSNNLQSPIVFDLNGESARERQWCSALLPLWNCNTKTISAEWTLVNCFSKSDNAAFHHCVWGNMEKEDLVRDIEWFFTATGRFILISVTLNTSELDSCKKNPQPHHDCSCHCENKTMHGQGGRRPEPWNILVDVCPMSVLFQTVVQRYFAWLFFSNEFVVLQSFLFHTFSEYL